MTADGDGKRSLMAEKQEGQDEGLDPAVDSATGQVIDQDYEEDAAEDGGGAGAPALEDIGAVDSENTSVYDPAKGS